MGPMHPACQKWTSDLEYRVSLLLYTRSHTLGSLGASISSSKNSGTRRTEASSYPQIPVLRMAMVTSPGFKSDPAATLSAVGSAGLIHKSWLGLVYTPMLGLRDDLADETGVSACVAVGAMSPAQNRKDTRKKEGCFAGLRTQKNSPAENRIAIMI